MNADIDALADEITKLCGHMDAAEYRLLEPIRRFDEVAPWGAWELRSCAHWLNWKCGIALGAAREKVRVAHALPELPKLSEAFREGRLSYSKVRALTRIAKLENEGLLVEMGLSATAAQIEKIVRKQRYVERLKAADHAMALYESRSLTYWAADGALIVQGRLTPEQDALMDLVVPDGDRHHFEVVVHVSAEALKANGAIDSEDPPVIEDGPVLSPDTVRRLTCDAGIVPLIEGVNGEALAFGRKTRTIPPALRRAVKRRDAGCRFPGCTCTRFVDAHHIHHWADGGQTRLDNLVLLCRHHHRLIHEGGYRVERTIDGAFDFRDPHGVIVPITGEKRFRGNVHALFATDVAIDANTTTPNWDGEDPDYDHVLWVMNQ